MRRGAYSIVLLLAAVVQGTQLQRQACFEKDVDCLIVRVKGADGSVMSATLTDLNFEEDTPDDVFQGQFRKSFPKFQKKAGPIQWRRVLTDTVCDNDLTMAEHFFSPGEVVEIEEDGYVAPPNEKKHKKNKKIKRKEKEKTETLHADKMKNRAREHVDENL